MKSWAIITLLILTMESEIDQEPIYTYEDLN